MNGSALLKQYVQRFAEGKSGSLQTVSQREEQGQEESRKLIYFSLPDADAVRVNSSYCTSPTNSDCGDSTSSSPLLHPGDDEERQVRDLTTDEWTLSSDDQNTSTSCQSSMKQTDPCLSVFTRASSGLVAPVESVLSLLPPARPSCCWRTSLSAPSPPPCYCYMLLLI